MSSRYYDKGSSRSTRDDSRKHSDEHDDRRNRSRSRSPKRNRSPGSSKKHSPDRYARHKSRNSDKRREMSYDSEDEVPAPPPPPRITKVSIDMKSKGPIKMNLGGKTTQSAIKPTVASVFNADDDDEEPEEMPAEAKMRMRNIGRETPTSAGPNSFGKTKQGFCDSKKVFEKNLKEALESADRPATSSFKFPQTIYKIKP